MKISFISDLHVDSNFIYQLTKENVLEFWNYLEYDFSSDVLIIAGDISNNHKLNLLFLTLTKKVLNVKYILFTLGNHDLYDFIYNQDEELLKYYNSRIKFFRKNLPNDIILLEGNIVEIDNIKFGGAMGWYDGSYTKKVFNVNEDKINDIWKTFGMDYQNIPGLEFYKDLFRIEYKLLQKINKEVDIMITHISPLNDTKYIEEKFKNSIHTGFFSFDGKDLLTENIKIWIYGHTHTRSSFKHQNIDFFCNPLGYFGENENIKVISFEL